jgi:hypothetical protein
MFPAFRSLGLVLALGLLSSCAGNDPICVDPSGGDCKGDGGPVEPEVVSFANQVTADFSSCGTSVACHAVGAANGLELEAPPMTCDELYTEVVEDRTDTSAGGGPRLDPTSDSADPAASFWMQKSIGVDHGGGPSVDPASDLYTRWVAWIQQGAANDCP